MLDESSVVQRPLLRKLYHSLFPSLRRRPLSLPLGLKASLSNRLYGAPQSLSHAFVTYLAHWPSNASRKFMYMTSSTSHDKLR